MARGGDASGGMKPCGMFYSGFLLYFQGEITSWVDLYSKIICMSRAMGSLNDVIENTF